MNKRIKELAKQAADGMLSYDAEGEWRLSRGRAKDLSMIHCNFYPFFSQKTD